MRIIYGTPPGAYLGACKAVLRASEVNPRIAFAQIFMAFSTNSLSWAHRSWRAPKTISFSEQLNQLLLVLGVPAHGVSGITRINLAPGFDSSFFALFSKGPSMSAVLCSIWAFQSYMGTSHACLEFISSIPGAVPSAIDSSSNFSSHSMILPDLFYRQRAVSSALDSSSHFSCISMILPERLTDQVQCPRHWSH